MNLKILEGHRKTSPPFLKGVSLYFSLLKRESKRDFSLGGFKLLIFQTLLCLFSISPAFAGKSGLSTKFSMVNLENLQPGVAYNTRELVNMPLVVRNTGENRTSVRIELLKPQISSAMAERNFEPIPDLSWVRLNRCEFDIDPGKSADTDVIVQVPDEDKYLGKRYQVDIHIEGAGALVNVALLGSMRFTMAAKRVKKAGPK